MLGGIYSLMKTQIKTVIAKTNFTGLKKQI